MRLEEGDEKVNKRKQMLDAHLQKLVSDLLYFEGALRKEQSEIKLTLDEKETVIKSQKRTIESLMTANIALTKALKKLKRKYKGNARADQETVTSSETSRVIQQEADALISQIFSNSKKSYTEPYPDEVFEEAYEQDTGDVGLMEPETEKVPRRNSSPHVFFCLTESKDENSTKLKLKTNTASYPLSPILANQNDQNGADELMYDHDNYNNDPYSEEEHYSSCQTDDQKRFSARNATLNVSPSKSCPNLGLAVIEEEIHFVPDRGRPRSESADYLLDDVIDADDDVDSDVFSASHNSCSSVSVFESSFTSSIGGTELERVYENTTGQYSLQRQHAFEEKSFDDNSKDLPENTTIVPDEEVSPPGDNKWKQIRSPPRSSSFNLLSRIRRPRDLKKKKATRAASDGENKNQPPERQRKLTL